MNICCVFVGDISFEVKTEADSNDSTAYPHDDKPSTGMFGVTDYTDPLLLIGQFGHSTFLKVGRIMNLAE